MAHLQDLSAAEVVDVVNDETFSGLVANGIPPSQFRPARKKILMRNSNNNRFRTRLGAAESSNYASAVTGAGSLTATGTAYGNHG